jgi:UDP-N-acetylmuramate: L-alanyl-gamma-D-glutamyl-meso-diaminopimelate ligase
MLARLEVPPHCLWDGAASSDASRLPTHSALMKIHLIGIAGTGMGALARLLLQAGHEVRGSDAAIYPPMSDQLAEAGIPVFSGFGDANLQWGPDCVVVGNVCSADHVEVVAARNRGLQLESFPSMLAKALLPGRDPLVVAGTHGKTTTTSVLAWLLRACGRDPSFLIGGVPVNLHTGAHLGEGNAFVLEGDEYDTAFFDKRSKFLHYAPKRAILTSVELDHLDIFDSFDAMRDAFRAFVQTIAPTGELIVNLDDSEAMGVAASATCKLLTYTVLADASELSVSRPAPVENVHAADYTAVCRRKIGHRTVFEVFEHGESLGEFSTGLVGRFNVANVLAAVAMCRREGVDVDALRTAVARFRGVKRRQELIGIAAGVSVISDFAHHPTATQLTVTALRKHFPEKALHVCFEPRSASSRRRHFLDAYAAAFDAATHVYIGPLHHPEKIPDVERLDTAALARAISERGVSARAFDSVDALADAVLERAVPGDTVAMLSSGSFEGLGDKLLHGFGDPVTFGTPHDIPAVSDLLEGYGLPPIATSDDVETLVLRGLLDGRPTVVGCVSLEVVGDSGVLFGLAVTPQRRGQGLGWVLGDFVLRRSRMLGLRRVYLVANTATDFFAGKLGFSPVDPAQIGPGVLRSANFEALQGLAGAVCMELPLEPVARQRP